jgi:hypothetical protein
VMRRRQQPRHSVRADDWGRAVSLVTATHFDEGSAWRGTLVPAAGEMSAYFGSFSRAPRGHRSSEQNSEKHLRDRVRRAKKRIRQFTVSNKLNCLLTLTFAEAPEDVNSAAALTVDSFRRVFYKSPRAPYVWTLEAGRRHGRIHAHALLDEACASRVVTKWTLGITDCQLFATNAESLRTASSYLSKDLNTALVDHGQSYRIPKGFTPEAHRLPAGLDPSVLIRHASDLMGSSPVSVRESPGHPALTALWEV